jgi:anthranilate synthase component II
MKILIFDNYDSFTYNLFHLVEKYTDATVDVIRNDKITLEQIDAYQKIILSPGPGLPEQAGILIPLIKKYYKYKSILGVCLGHQAINNAMGGRLRNLNQVLHGIAINTKIVGDSYLFSGCPDQIKTGRYHSWVVDEKAFPEDLKITAISEDDSIMAFSHREYDLQGVQFHPESVLTEYGEQIIKNWVNQ